MDEESFHRREALVERAGRLLVIAFVLAAGLGLFGPGPLSHSSARDRAGDVQVDYLRFARAGGSADVVVRFGSPVGVEDFEIALTRRYLDEMTVEAVTPEPERVVTDGEWTVFVFAVRATSPTQTVTFSLTPSGMGPVRGAVRAGDHSPVNFHQFVYP